MSSDTTTFRCCRPLWTMNVCPMNSGGIVLRRDQVLIGLRVPFLISASTFFIRWSSMKGPFFVLRAMGMFWFPGGGERVGVSGVVRAGLAAPQDELVRGVVPAPRLPALGEHAARRAGVTTAGGAAFAAAHRVVDRVLSRAAHGRSVPHVALAAGLAQADVLVIGVADPPDRRTAADVDPAQFARRKQHDRVFAFAGGQLRNRARRTAQLAAAARRELDVVDLEAEGDLGQRQRVAEER